MSSIDPIHLQEIQDALSEALPERKRSKVSEQDIVNEYNRLQKEGMLEEIPGEDFKYKYFPLKEVDLVVCSFISKFKDADEEKRKTFDKENSDLALNMRKPSENANERSDNKHKIFFSNTELSCSELPSQLKKSKLEPEKGKDQKYFSPNTMIVSLMNLYPDIDPLYLKGIIDNNETFEEIQNYIEKNLDKIPERRSIQAIQYQVLQVQLERDEELWQCPGCRSWQKIQKSDQDIFCVEINSCGSYCKSCRVKSHQPFDCRTSTVRHHYPEKGDETDIFRPLTTQPSLVKPTFRVFIMMPRNETDYSNPLDILYTAAEGTFLKMLKIAGDQHFSVTTPTSSPSLLPPLPPRHPSATVSLASNPINSTAPTSLILSSTNSTTVTVSSTAVASGRWSSSSPPEHMRQNSSSSHLTPGANPLPSPSNANAASSTTASDTHGLWSWFTSSNAPGSSSQVSWDLGGSMPLPTPASVGSRSSSSASCVEQDMSPSSVTPASFYAPSSAGISSVQSTSSTPSSVVPNRSLPPALSVIHTLPPRSRLTRDVNRKVFDRSFIKEIHYFENDSLTERFRRCKDRMEASGFPCKERLVFHGTSADIDSIMEKGFLMSMCKRSAYGVGIYFSEFPNISKMYGKTLLLCRVLIGKPYYGHENTIPQGFNSKIVQLDGDGKAKIIVINKEDQILPAFQVKVEWDNT